MRPPPVSLPHLLLAIAIFLAQPAQAENISAAPDRAEFLKSFSTIEQAEPSSAAPDGSEFLKSFSAIEQPKTVTVKTTQAKVKKKKPFVPPGFEHLLEPQTTQVDVYYGSSYLTSTLATFTPNEITLLDPRSVVAKLPDLLDPDQVEQYLTRELRSNSGFVCLTANQSNCGKLDPTTAEVIFDDNRFRVDLFLSKDLLAVRDSGIDQFLPASDAGLSLLNVISATVNGEDGRDASYNIANSTTIAFRESRLFAISNYNETEDISFDTLALQREFAGQQFQAGIFRSSPGSLVFIRETDFLGLNFGSSLDTRTDLNQSSGNELQLFLDSRSRVDILKDGRLISTATYNTGNQILDTSRLPGGAYDVVLRIRDSSGIVREETRFYVKSNRLPPLGQTLYFVDLGEQVSKNPDRSLPSRNGEGLIRLGFSRRITRDFGGEFGVISDTDQSLVEAGIFRLGRNYDLRFNVAAGADQARAASIISNFRIGNITLGANLRETRSDGNSLLGNTLTQGSLTASRPIGQGSLHLSARVNKRQGATDKNYGLRYEFPALTFHNKIMSTNLQASRDNGDWQVLLSARMSIKNNRWQTTLTSQGYYEDNQGQPADSGFINNLSSTWQDGDRYLSDVSLALRAVDERFDRTLESELNIASQLGRANIETVYSEENDALSYGASFYTSIIANRDTFTFGGKRQARSAVVLDIRGEAEDAYFDVSVNKLVRDNATIGTKTVLPLAPFRTYDIMLRSKGSALVDFNNATQTTTLYPGNVVTLTWEASRILVAFGQIIDKKGEPIKNGLIEGVVGLATTDDFGVFQAELKSTTQSFTVRTRTTHCAVALPALPAKDLIATLGVLICEPL